MFPHTKVDEEFTQVSSSNTFSKNEIDARKKINKVMISKFNNDEQSESSLDVSSFNENQIKKLFVTRQKNKILKKDQINKNIENISNEILRSKSPVQTRKSENVDELFSTLDTTRYYDLERFQNPIKVSKDIQRNDIKKESNTFKEKEENKFPISKKVGTLDFLTNIFKSKSKKLDQNETNQTKKSIIVNSKDSVNNLEQSNLNPNKPILYPHMSSNQTDIQSIIREQLKQIFQIQHSSVLNFLNGDSSQNRIFENNQILADSNLLGFNNKLVDTLNKNRSIDKTPLEFIIETKIEPLDFDESPNLKNFKANIQVRNSNIHNKETEDVDLIFKKPIVSYKKTLMKSKKSNFIKIPLLSTNYSQTSAIKEQIFINQNERLNDEKNSKSEVFENFLKFEKGHKLNFDIIENPNIVKTKKEKIKKKNIPIVSSKSSLKYENFPLLKFELKTQFPIKESAPEKILSSDSNNEINLLPTKEVPIQKLPDGLAIQEKVDKKTAEIQVEKPIYDGFILAPSTFDDMLNKENEKLAYDSASAHHNATDHLRNKEKIDQPLKNNFAEKSVMTDVSSLKNPISTKILFELKYDSKKEEKPENFSSRAIIDKDFLNVADLDNKNVERMLNLIERNQNERKNEILTVNEKPEINKSVNNENQIKDLDECLPMKELLNNEFFLNSKRIEDDRITYDEIRDEHLKISQDSNTCIKKKQIINSLNFIDDKIKLINEFSEQMSKDFEKYNKITNYVENLSSQRSALEKMINSKQSINPSIELEKLISQKASEKSKQKSNETDSANLYKTVLSEKIQNSRIIKSESEKNMMSELYDSLKASKDSGKNQIIEESFDKTLQTNDLEKVFHLLEENFEKDSKHEHQEKSSNDSSSRQSKISSRHSIKKECEKERKQKN